MKQKMTQRKQQYETRDPLPKTRDPEPVARVQRRYIPASAPVVCPDCGGSTRMADGRHVDPVRRTILEYRTCARCGCKLAAGRAMVNHEIARHCTGFESGVKEYQESMAGR